MMTQPSEGDAREVRLSQTADCAFPRDCKNARNNKREREVIRARPCAYWLGGRASSGSKADVGKADYEKAKRPSEVNILSGVRSRSRFCVRNFSAVRIFQGASQECPKGQSQVGG